VRFERLNNLRNRLVLLFFLITGAAVGFVYLYVVPQLESSLIAEKLSRLDARADEVRPRLERAIRLRLPQERLDELVQRMAQAGTAHITVLGLEDAGGESVPAFVVSDSRGATRPPTGEFEIAARAAAGSTATGTETLDGERSAEVAIPLPPEDPVWVAVLSESLDEVEDNVGLIKRQILIAGAIALALALVAGWYAAGTISRRIGRLEDAAQKVAAGDFATPIPVDSSDELGQLARTFNDMQRRLADLDNARKRFIANASHELRTPIFSLGGFVELLEDEDPDPESRAEFVRTMREQVTRLTKLTTDLLDLSRLDADALEFEPRQIDLGVVARQVAREFGPIAGQRGSRLEVRTTAEAALAEADPERVRQILRILLDNALSHTPEGTKVTVTSYTANSRSELTVSNEGPGIPKRVQERMFERFYTGDAVSGSGLGLPIARELAQRMGGSVAATSRKGFTAFTLDLPRAADREPATATREAPA
jgi:two-component system, OmpR family, sensor kinase